MHVCMYVRMCVYVCMYIYRYISSYLGTLYSEFQDESHPYDLPPKNAWFQRLRSVSQRHGVGFGLWSPEQKSVSKRKARETLRSALMVVGTDFEGKNARVPMGKS